jgi:hypothetical protein
MKVSRFHRKCPGHRAGLFRFQGTYSTEILGVRLSLILAWPSPMFFVRMRRMKNKKSAGKKAAETRRITQNAKWAATMAKVRIRQAVAKAHGHTGTY